MGILQSERLKMGKELPYHLPPSPGFTAKPLVGRFHVPLSFWLLEMDRW